MPSGDAHRSLARALDILELCSLNGSGYTLTQLSQHLGIAKGSISPLLHTLRDRGYLTLDDQDHHYRIGPHGVPHWKHLSGRSQRPAGDLPPDA